MFNFNYEKGSSPSHDVPSAMPPPSASPSSTSVNPAPKQMASNQLMSPMIRGGHGNKRVTKRVTKQHRKSNKKQHKQQKRVTKK